MSIPFWQRAWLDGAREHYDQGEPDEGEESDEWTEMAVDSIPFPDDHDRQFMDYYDTREGDIGDQAFDLDNPPF